MLALPKIRDRKESKMTRLLRNFALAAAALLLASCQSGTTVTDQDAGASPVVVTNVLATALEGTVMSYAGKLVTA